MQGPKQILLWGEVGGRGCTWDQNVAEAKARRKHPQVPMAGDWQDFRARVRTLGKDRVRVWPLDSPFRDLSTSLCDFPAGQLQRPSCLGWAIGPEVVASEGPAPGDKWF